MSIARLFTQGTLSRPCISLWLPLMRFVRLGKGAVLPVPTLKYRPRMELLLPGRFARSLPILRAAVHLSRPYSRRVSNHQYTAPSNSAKPQRHFTVTPNNYKIQINYSFSHHCNIYPSPQSLKTTQQLATLARRGPTFNVTTSLVHFSSKDSSQKIVLIRSNVLSGKISFQDLRSMPWLNQQWIILAKRFPVRFFTVKGSKIVLKISSLAQEYSPYLRTFMNDVIFRIPQNYPNYFTTMKNNSNVTKFLSVSQRYYSRLSSVLLNMKNSPQMTRFKARCLKHLTDAVIFIRYSLYPVFKSRIQNLRIREQLLNIKNNPQMTKFSEICIKYSSDAIIFIHKKYPILKPKLQNAKEQYIQTCTRLSSNMKMMFIRLHPELRSRIQNLRIEERLLNIKNSPQITNFNERCIKHTIDPLIFISKKYPTLNPKLQNARAKVVQTQTRLSSETKMLFIRMYPELKSRIQNLGTRAQWSSMKYDYPKLFSALKNLRTGSRLACWAKNYPIHSIAVKYVTNLRKFLESSRAKNVKSDPKLLSASGNCIKVDTVYCSEVSSKQNTVAGNFKSMSDPPCDEIPIKIMRYEISPQKESNEYSQYSRMRRDSSSTRREIESSEKLLNTSQRYFKLIYEKRVFFHYCTKGYQINNSKPCRLSPQYRNMYYSFIQGLDYHNSCFSPMISLPRFSFDSQDRSAPSLYQGMMVSPSHRGAKRRSACGDDGGHQAPPRVAKGMERWVNKVALVTGANSGIGLAVTHKLISNGMVVVAVDKNRNNLQALEEKMKQEGKEPCKLSAHSCDVSDDKQVMNLFKDVCCKFGGVDVAVCNAGLALPGSLLDADPCDWRYVMDVNVIALALFAKETVRRLQERPCQEGHVIFIGSLAGHVISPYEDLHFYMVTKHAVTALTEAFRQELVARSLPIRISQICPGYVYTDFNVAMFEGHTNREHRIATYYPKIELMQSRDIANTVLYTLSTPPHVQVHDIIIRPRAQQV